jgi:hypothetical protein
MLPGAEPLSRLLSECMSDIEKKKLSKAMNTQHRAAFCTRNYFMRRFTNVDPKKFRMPGALGFLLNGPKRLRIRQNLKGRPHVIRG